MIKSSISQNIVQTDCLVIPILDTKDKDIFITDLDSSINNSIKNIKELGDFKAAKGESKMIFPQHDKIKRILLIGLGKQKDLSVKKWKEVISQATISAQNIKCKKISFYVAPKFIAAYDGLSVARETTLAVQIGAYSFDSYKDKKSRVTPISAVTFISTLTDKEIKQFKKGIKEGNNLGAAINLTRELGNVPPAEMTPDYLVKEAKRIAKEYDSVSTKILRKKEMEKLGMGCLLGVAKGSILPPAFIIMEHKGGKKDEAPTVLIGKGITFDSGGLSLKPGAYMVDMKFDMLGAATVFGIMQAAASLAIKKNITVLVPTCENMPGPEAYRPDDILFAMNGKSVLIKNTDAEGRLILADALCYAHTLKPLEVIDFATLTGACVVALGNQRSALFTPKDDMSQNILQAAKTTGEHLWRLPVGDEYSAAMKSDIADIQNMGNVGGRGYGGASTAASFLQFFTKDYTDKKQKSYDWAHVDLSCSYYGGKGKAHIRGGANGFGVQTFVNYLRSN